MPELIIFHRGQPLLREGLQSSLTLGQAKDNDIGLIDGVADYHARIEITPEAILVTPLGGPVYVNGEKTLGSHALQDGDLFDIGAYRCQIFEKTRSSIDKKEKTVGTDVSETKNPAPVLQFLSPVKKKFRRTRIILGRSSGCDLEIDNHYVSSQHAEIFLSEGKYMLRDLHSRNGTFVNDFRVTERPLPSSGIIRLGKYQMTYQIEETEKSEKLPGFPLPSVRAGVSDRMLIGSSAVFRKLMEKLKKIAATDDPVLLLGETGTGKDLFAQYLHNENPRRKAHPFVVVNCATIPQTLAESQLFGHTRGSFSGAVTDHKGFFQEANRGTLFLDEIGDLPLESQARLLRVIEDGLIRPLGGGKEYSVDVRPVFATNRDLDGARYEGKFREDLFQRFQWILTIPPLRERREDIPHLVHYFLQQHAPEPLSVAPETLKILQQCEWRGNIRELNRAVRRAITNAISRGSGAVSWDDFEMETAKKSEQRPSEIRRDKRSSLKETLKSADGNISKAAEALGISRVTLYKWMEEDGLK
jgi:DNA-binding NtrC family response regulator/pSer/pThr/pTyr-binding forkhead associated (FHA) protein